MNSTTEPVQPIRTSAVTGAHTYTCEAPVCVRSSRTLNTQILFRVGQPIVHGECERRVKAPVQPHEFAFDATSDDLNP